MVRSGGSLRPDELPKWQKALRQISVSECEFSKPVDQVFLIQTGTAPGDIHVAERLSQTSCLLHPDFLPQVKKISTLSDRHLPEGFLPLRESSPNLCVHSSSSYVSPSMQPLSSGDLIEWSLVCHSTLSYQKFCDRHSNHYDHPEELHQSVE